MCQEPRHTGLRFPLRAGAMIPGSNHYPVMYEPATIRVARTIDDMVSGY